MLSNFCIFLPPFLKMLMTGWLFSSGDVYIRNELEAVVMLKIKLYVTFINLMVFGVIIYTHKQVSCFVRQATFLHIWM